MSDNKTYEFIMSQSCKFTFRALVTNVRVSDNGRLHATVVADYVDISNRYYRCNPKDFYAVGPYVLQEYEFKE